MRLGVSLSRPPGVRMLGPYPMSSNTSFSSLSPSSVFFGAVGPLRTPVPILSCASHASSSSSSSIIIPFARFMLMSTVITRRGIHVAGTAVPGHGLYCVLALLCARLFALHRAALVGGTGSGPGPGFRFREGRPRGTFRARGLSGGCVLRLFVLFCGTVALFCFFVCSLPAVYLVTRLCFVVLVWAVWDTAVEGR